ncbi:RNA polymerase sigma-70 factor [Chryseolinea sp. H1M3-3]|uniref:RNA polymerase sigma factor n=1 Tax=Chryseolinea sp. H1M3-3 TaxID=3034144 RepID=UPI0023EBAE33|nr:RNA polymerase sigma-70 factor [Chryseolinea sp. H1M3-3]
MNDIALRELAKRIKASDPVAFEMVFNLFHDTIFKFLLFKTKDADTAEDILQEVFFKLWNARFTLNEHQSLKNYLYTIADNQVLNHLRHLKVVQSHLQQKPSRLFSVIDNPQFILEEKEWKLKLMNAIDNLPEKTRIIFLMSRMEDLTYMEIAERLSLSVKTVEGHMVKALKLLRQSVSAKL